MDRFEAFLLANEFLAREARLLDERRFDEWFEMLHDDIVYFVPIREGRMSFAEEWGAGGYRIRDDKVLIDVRIKRLKTGFAWAETPPSRTLRVVGSVVAEPIGDDRIQIDSAMILYRQRGHDQKGDVIPVRRRDEVILVGQAPLLLRRTAEIAEVVLSTPNLGLFL